jgi:RimJ/RimL family protein N-acetyltransferase
MLELKVLSDLDAPVVYNLINNSRGHLGNLVWAPTATLESTTEFLRTKSLSEDTVRGVFEDGVLVGVVELRAKDDAMELGYWLGYSYRGRGIMREAVKMLVDALPETTIIGHIRAKNIASNHTLTFAGLTQSHCEMWQGEQWLHFKREAYGLDCSLRP